MWGGRDTLMGEDAAPRFELLFCEDPTAVAAVMIEFLTKK
jgi:hypothetical protein